MKSPPTQCGDFLRDRSPMAVVFAEGADSSEYVARALIESLDLKITLRRRSSHDGVCEFDASLEAVEGHSLHMLDGAASLASDGIEVTGKVVGPG